MTDNQKATLKSNLQNVLSLAKCAMEKSGRSAQQLRVVLATKTQTAESINFAAQCGISEIGENRVQELLEKYDALDKHLKIHFIGTLQTNKVKYIIDKVCLIHSVNSKKLADEIDRQARKHGIVMEVLIELNLQAEQSKTGVDLNELYELIYHASKLKNLRVVGLMAIPPAPKIVDEATKNAIVAGSNVNNLQINDDLPQYFTKIHQIFLDISTKKIDNISMDILSLGMSADFECAILHGSNMIRPGRAVFGERG